MFSLYIKTPNLSLTLYYKFVGLNSLKITTTNKDNAYFMSVFLFPFIRNSTNKTTDQSGKLFDLECQ